MTDLLIENYDSEIDDEYEEGSEDWCCNEKPDEQGLCPICRDHIN